MEINMSCKDKVAFPQGKSGTASQNMFCLFLPAPKGEKKGSRVQKPLKKKKSTLPPTFSEIPLMKGFTV